MILNLLFYASLLLSTPTIPVKLDCEKFREGTFESYDENKKSNFVSFTRSANRQVEYSDETGGSTELIVTWIDNCSYYLSYVSSTDEEDEILKNHKLLIRIIEIDGDMYKYVAKLEGVKEAPTVFGWIKKLKD